MDSRKDIIAVFDFDGTITPKDSFLEFIKYTHGNIKFYLFILTHLHIIILFYFKIISNQRLKEIFFSGFYRGLSKEELLKNGEIFSQKIIPEICFPEALKIINWHKNNGHKIYLLTASSNIWLGEWCKINDIELIGTKFQLVENRYTGKIEGKNCYGKEKWERIKEIANNAKKSYGYGDSKSDLYFIHNLDFHFLFPLNSKNFKSVFNNLKSSLK
jgi:phosphatidylglycerophosphatase C